MTNLGISTKIKSLLIQSQLKWKSNGGKHSKIMNLLKKKKKNRREPSFWGEEKRQTKTTDLVLKSMNFVLDRICNEFEEENGSGQSTSESSIRWDVSCLVLNAFQGLAKNVYCFSSDWHYRISNACGLFARMAAFDFDFVRFPVNSLFVAYTSRSVVWVSNEDWTISGPFRRSFSLKSAISAGSAITSFASQSLSITSAGSRGIISLKCYSFFFLSFSKFFFLKRLNLTKSTLSFEQFPFRRRIVFFSNFSLPQYFSEKCSFWKWYWTCDGIAVSGPQWPAGLFRKLCFLFLLFSICFLAFVCFEERITHGELFIWFSFWKFHKFTLFFLLKNSHLN